MHNSKLFHLLRLLEPNEWHWLHKFLKSPYHNSNPQYLQLFEYIKKYHPNLEHPKLSKEAAHKKLFQHKRRTPSKGSDALSTDFDPQKMRKLMHELAVLVEEFLVIHNVKNNVFEHRKIYISELGRRNHYKVFEKETHKLLGELEQEEKRGENHFLERYQLRKQLFGHPLTVRGKNGINDLLKLSEEMDSYYLWQKLSLGCSFEAGKRIYETNTSVPFAIHIKQALESLKDNIAEVDLYYYAYQMLKNRQNESSFKEGYDVFLKREKQLEANVKEELLKCFIGYATFQLNRGKAEYVRYNFELYKIGLSSDLLLKDGRMSSTTFGNIINSGIFLKEFLWVESFIDNYQQFLDEELKQEVIATSYSNIAFSKGDFSYVVDILNLSTFHHILYKILSKTLLLKTYYELLLQDKSYFEILLAHCNAFEKFLRREKQISKNSQESLLNFMKILRKMVDCHARKLPFKNLQKEIQHTTPLSNKPWLERKLKNKGKKEF